MFAVTCAHSCVYVCAINDMCNVCGVFVCCLDIEFDWFVLLTHRLFSSQIPPSTNWRLLDVVVRLR